MRVGAALQNASDPISVTERAYLNPTQIAAPYAVAPPVSILTTPLVQHFW